jgi:hypothetical protein
MATPWRQGTELGSRLHCQFSISARQFNSQRQLGLNERTSNKWQGNENNGGDTMRRPAPPMIGGLVTTSVMTLLVYPVILYYDKRWEVLHRRHAKQQAEEIVTQ